MSISRTALFFTSTALTLLSAQSSAADLDHNTGVGGVTVSKGEPVEDSVIYYSGIDTAHHSMYLYQGGVVALNRDLSKDGFLLKAYSGYAGYQFGSDAGPLTQGNEVQVDGMLGYQFIRSGITTSLFVGADFQVVTTVPKDPTAVPAGRRLGAKVGVEIETDSDRKFYGNLIGEYSTAFESYWTRGRAGYNFGRFTMGPEAIAFGNQGFHAERLGVFATTKLGISKKLPIELTISGGHQFVNSSSSSGGAVGDSGGFGGGAGYYLASGMSISF